MNTDMIPQLFFFIGKGGVGKSTASALFSIRMALDGRDTLLVSMDPAHNQQDLFEREFSERPVQTAENLAVKEVDADFWIEKYLKESQKQITGTYRYQSAFNLQNYFNVLQFSPGLEEYALLLAFEDIVHRFHERDCIVFDMAPTALSLRFFSLPSITLIWLEELLKLRTKIYEKKEIISRIKIGKKEIEQDKVKEKLQVMIANYDHLGRHFRSGAAKIHLVMNNDRLSLSEAFRIREKLSAIGIGIHKAVVNKHKSGDDLTKIEKQFGAANICRIPLAPAPIIGYPALEEYAGKLNSD